MVATVQMLSPVVNVTVTGIGGTPFEHRWKRSFGSGHASLTLRDDWRAHLMAAASELGLAGVRHHGLFVTLALLMTQLRHLASDRSAGLPLALEERLSHSDRLGL